MKKTFLLTLSLMTFASFAQSTLPQGVEYSREGTESEYPAAFKVKADTTIYIAKKADPNAAKTVKCSLKKNKSIIFAKMTAVTLSYATGKYEVLKDTMIDAILDDGSSVSIPVAAGKTIENASYIAEGFCTVRFEGKEYGASCIGMANGDDTVKVVSELDQETWVKLACANKTTGWVNQRTLEASKKLESFFYNRF